MPLTLGLVLSACASGPAKHATEGDGPVSVRARNELAAHNPLGLVHVGEGFERAGDLSGAYKLYGQALAADPKLLEARVALARTLGKLGEHDESIKRLTAMVGEYPDNQTVRHELVEAYVRAGDYKLATESLGPLVGTDKASPELLDLAGRLAQVNGNPTDARSYFDRALKKAPGNMAVTRHMALSFALAKDYTTAVAMLQVDLDSAATQTSAQESLAVVYALSGQYDAAMTIAKTIMDPDQAASLRLYYALLPKLEPAQQAEAVMFDRVPKDVLKRLSPDGAN
ncbi:tetratricopeptide repeat protein [Kordiimonas marina]|uniref:tetratricopeptide repeat protein n=1 Tax=Kordiimonas marina TaxID=2872312 RepID=UPI001FF3A30B|nr:tetratricopeptide repeat protein [Kordiimonas marina]MCJ9428889.1 tetratricopeptide repeat protein [Kordiimonas marina]